MSSCADPRCRIRPSPPPPTRPTPTAFLWNPKGHLPAGHVYREAPHRQAPDRDRKGGEGATRMLDGGEASAGAARSRGLEGGRPRGWTHARRLFVRPRPRPCGTGSSRTHGCFSIAAAGGRLEPGAAAAAAAGARDPLAGGRARGGAAPCGHARARPRNGAASAAASSAKAPMHGASLHRFAPHQPLRLHGFITAMRMRLAPAPRLARTPSATAPLARATTRWVPAGLLRARITQINRSAILPYEGSNDAPTGPARFEGARDENAPRGASAQRERRAGPGMPAVAARAARGSRPLQPRRGRALCLALRSKINSRRRPPPATWIPIRPRA
jgi:hypothetical protein